MWRTRVTFAQTGTDTVVSFLIDTDHGDTAAGAARVQSAVGGVLFGTISGWALTRMIVKVLTGVFDPQPTHFVIAWTYLGHVLTAAIAAVIPAATRAIISARQPAIDMLRDL